MGWLDVVSGIFKPIADVIEHVLPSGDAKIQLQQKMLEGQLAAASQVMDYEKQLLDSQMQIIKAEAQGNSWMQRNWRPITMLTFLALVVCDSFGWLPNRLAPEAWVLLQIGLGGYVAGRSLEKIAPSIMSVVKK
jgi:Holin of 3TMs, for gene-transfer release